MHVCLLVFIFHCEKGKGIHPLAQCAGFCLFPGTGRAQEATPGSVALFWFENTGQEPPAGHTAKLCWYLARGKGAAGSMQLLMMCDLVVALLDGYQCNKIS